MNGKFESLVRSREKFQQVMYEVSVATGRIYPSPATRPAQLLRSATLSVSTNLAHGTRYFADLTTGHSPASMCSTSFIHSLPKPTSSATFRTLLLPRCGNDLSKSRPYTLRNPATRPLEIRRFSSLFRCRPCRHYSPYPSAVRHRQQPRLGTRSLSAP
jgi:hypothetical protein